MSYTKFLHYTNFTKKTIAHVKWKTLCVPNIQYNTKHIFHICNLFHRTFSTFIWLSCILHTICHAIPFLTNNALLDFTKCIQITKLTWVSPATNYFIFIITFYSVLKCLTDYKFSFKSKYDTFYSVCLELQWLKKKLGLLSVKSLHWHTIHLTRCLSVLDFWNVNLGVYYKLEKKIEFEINLIFCQVRTWFLLPV